MKRPLFLAVGLVAVMAASAEAQLYNIPVYSLPSAGEAPATFLGGGWGRGLNENSGKMNAFAGFVGRSGIGGSLSAALGVGYADLGAESKINFGVSGGVDVIPAADGVGVAVQVGIGYISMADEVWQMNFPIGVALKTNMPAGSGTITPFVMPRIHMARSSVLGTSTTNTEFGASGGLAFNTAGGFGFHAALDWLAVEDAAPILFGVGLHYVIPQG
jgi:hypothetical protein